MPMIMRSIHDIMGERQRDTVFIEFPDLHSFDKDDRSQAVAARQRHWAWFEGHGVEWESAAPRGWLEGDPGIYLLHVEPDAPQIVAYTAAFETAEGVSLDPKAYQAVVLIYANWLRAQASRADT